MPLFVPISRRGATPLVCAGVALAITAAPLQAHASQLLPTTATMATGMSPTAARLRTIMSLTQAPDEAPVTDAPADAPENTPPVAPVAEGPAPVAEGPHPSVPVSIPSPPSKGLGLMISGAVLTGAVALPLIGYGAYIVAIGKRVDDDVDGMGVVQTGTNLLGGFVLAFGVISLAVGAPMLGVGAYRFSKYQKWKNSQQVKWSPSMNRTAHGTFTTGVTLRF